MLRMLSCGYTVYRVMRVGRMGTGCNACDCLCPCPQAAQQYADQLQAAHGSQLSSMPDARKRKRTSSLAYSSNSSRFEEQLSMPGTPTQVCRSAVIGVF